MLAVHRPSIVWRPACRTRRWWRGPPSTLPCGYLLQTDNAQQRCLASAPESHLSNCMGLSSSHVRGFVRPYKVTGHGKAVRALPS
jgi:hypothetical protein